MNESHQTTYVRRTVLFVGAALCLWLVVYFGTHGKVVVQNRKTWDSVFIQTYQDNPNQKSYIKGNSSVLKSGIFFVTFNKGTDSNTYRISVGRWFKKTVLSPSVPPQANAIKIANNTRDLHIEVDKTVYSMDEGVKSADVEAQIPVSSFPFVQNSTHKLPTLFKPLAVYGNNFIGTEQSSQGDYFAKYDPVSGNLQKLSESIITSGATTYVFVGSKDKGGLVYYVNGRFYYLKDLSNNSIALNVATNSFSSSDTGPMAGFSGSKLYLYEGLTASDFKVSAAVQGANKKVSSDSLSITVFDVNSNRSDKVIKIKSDGSIVNKLIASPENRYLGLVGNKGITIYGLERGSMVTRFIYDYSIAFLWEDDNTLLALDPTKGISRLNIQKDSVSTVFATNTLQKYTGLEKYGRMLFVSGQIKIAKGQRIYAVDSRFNLDPVLYSVDLNAKAQNSNLMNGLPYITNYYTIDSLNGLVYFVPTTGDIRDPLFSNKTLYQNEINNRINAAKAYLKSNGIPESQVQFEKVLESNLKPYWTIGS